MTRGFQLGLAGFFLLCAALNFGFAQYYIGRPRLKQVWAGLGFLFFLHALIYFATGSVAPDKGPVIPQGIVDVTNTVLNHIRGPILYFVGSCAGFAALLYWRKTLTDPVVSIGFLNGILLLSGWAMTNSDFRSIITKEDNVPIVMLIFSVGFFTWLAFRKAAINDARTARGEPPEEKLDDEKVLVWPDLVYTELIAMIAVTFVLVIWSILLKAPLE